MSNLEFDDDDIVLPKADDTKPDLGLKLPESLISTMDNIPVVQDKRESALIPIVGVSLMDDLDATIIDTDSTRRMSILGASLRPIYERSGIFITFCSELIEEGNYYHEEEFITAFTRFYTDLGDLNVAFTQSFEVASKVCRPDAHLGNSLFDLRNLISIFHLSILSVSNNISSDNFISQLELIVRNGVLAMTSIESIFEKLNPAEA